MFKPTKLLIIAAMLSVVAVLAGRVQATASTIGLPAPVEWAASAVAPSAPGDSFGISFSDPSGTVVPNAPAIGEWNRTTMPGESFTITGVRFTSRSGADSGTDTTVWIWADTPSGGTLRQAKIWKVTDNIITATIPEDVPFGMYLIWVENEAGVSSPICMNRTQAQWIGPLGNTVSAGDTKRVFGKNLSSGHGTTTSFVYIQPSAGGSFISCPVTGVEPFAVKFTVPAGTVSGSYKVYVHNGQGGAYGWSDPLDLVVADQWVRGSIEVPVNPSGVDDTAAIQSAINTLTALPTGGTVRLASGTYILKSNIGLKANVRIAGAGMSQTTVQARLTSNVSQLIDCLGSRISVEDLAINIANTGFAPQAQAIRQPYPFQPAYGDMSLKNVKMTEDTGLECTGVGFFGPRCLVTGCDFSLVIEVRDDGWVHDNTLHGGAYGMISWPQSNEYPAQGGPRLVYENNYTSTPAWPVGAAGDRNYTDWMSNADYWYTTWAKRMFGVQGSSCYIAHNTTQDVACEENKGEMVLFHGFGGSWWGQCLSTTGNTTTVRTDGLVFGQTVVSGNVYGTALTGSVPLPSGVDGLAAVVVSGAGVGQQRTILSHTTSSFTVDSPWRVPPDSTSMVLAVGLYRDHIVYKNDLNAFPPGYDLTKSNGASNGGQIDGNGWMIEMEGNVSHRNMTARELRSSSIGVSFWNTLRDEEAYEIGRAGFSNMTYDDNPVGYESLGNRFVGCTVQITAGKPTWGLGIYDAGEIAEHCNIAGGQQGLYVGQDGLYKDNTVSVRYAQTAPQPVYIYPANADPVLVGNTYSGWSPTYYTSTGCTFAEKPLPEYRAARFKGCVGASVAPQIVPLANAGISSLSWTATPSDSWITASVQSNPTLTAESTFGWLVIGVDTTGLPAGRRWGSVTVNTGTKSVKIGVCLDLSSGAPANISPVASFTATPSAGAVPLSVTFDATASHDTDGMIVGYEWDFGDGAFGTGITVSHSYSSVGTYTPVLTVTDNIGASGSSWTNISTSPVLSNLTLSGNPKAPVAVNTPVTLTASSVGGYQVQYRFFVDSGLGWSVMRDYSSVNTCSWTPTNSGFYRIKVFARNLTSPASYDLVSNELGYPVGLLPSDGLVLWLKADAGVTRDAAGSVSSWTDQSSAVNTVTQSFAGYQPTYASDSGNGKPAVRNGGGSSRMAAVGRVINGTSGFTCFGLLRYNGTGNPTANQYVFWNGIDSSSGGYGWYLDSAGLLNASWGSYSGIVTSPTVFTPGQFLVVSSRLSSGSHQMWVDGTLKGTNSKGTSNFTSGVFTAGNKGPTPSYGLNGDIQELIIYNRGLSESERVAVEGYLSMRYQPQTRATIPEVKSLLDGTSVSISSAKVVTVGSGIFSDGSYYVEEPDRFAGLKVVDQSLVGLGDRVTLSGVVETDYNGEKTLIVSHVDSRTSGEPIGVLGMTNKAFSGSGLLVRVWGKVVEKTPSYLRIDDGSGVPVRVAMDGLVTALTASPSIGQYISATGPAGMMSGGVSCVRPAADSDIQVYWP